MKTIRISDETYRKLIAALGTLNATDEQNADMLRCHAKPISNITARIIGLN